MKLQEQLCGALERHLAGGKAAPPEAGVILWNAFDALSRARTWHGAGPNPIQFSEVAAWCRLMNMPLSPDHVRVIMAMDQVWTGHMLRVMKPDAVEAKPAGDLTAALFDRVLG